jgi:PAS domain S-box-containing protein
MDVDKPTSQRRAVWPTPLRVSYAQEEVIPVSSRELKRLYDDLTRSEVSLRAVVERSPDAICVAAEDDSILYVNARLLRLLGYDAPSELLGRPASTTLVHAADLGRVAEARRRQLAGETVDTLEVRCLRRDGTAVSIEGSTAAIDFDGQRAWLTTARDITERVRLEERLRHAQKMQAVGNLAGGIAHDFNNLLAVILGGAELVAEELAGARPDVLEALGAISTAAHQAATLTRQLLAMSRAKAQRSEIIDLNAVVVGLGPALGRVVGESVTVSTRLASPLGAIETDPDHLEQLLQSLVVNAREAMPQGGKLTIETAGISLDGSAAAEAGVKPGSYVSLTVKDTGVGMDAATRARVFEPFFTTKDVGEGTGLGLAVAFGIVKECGGAISVDSEPGRGATFRVLFPTTSAPITQAPESAGPTTPASTRAPVARTVLVVEDDKQVRTVVQRLLSRSGYTVIVADGPHAALAILNERKGIDLVLTDLAMPGMDGRSMARIAAERHPELRFLFMSGYSEHTAIKGTPGPSENFVGKPFTPAGLRDAVRAALGQDKN